MTDPMTIMAAGSALTGVLGLVGNKSPSTNVTMPAAAPPVQSPVGSQTSATSNSSGSGTPSFLSAAAAPQANQMSGGKSLLGQ